MRQGRGRNANTMILSGMVLVLSLFWGISANGETKSAALQNQSDYGQWAKLGIGTLQAWYDEDTGLYKTTGWWNSANAVTVVADYSRITGSKEYDHVFSNTFTAAQKTFPRYINQYYDDEGWWALAWIDAYDLDKDPRYLAMAQSLFTDMSGGWDEVCGGGVWWSKEKKDKNAIENELFLSVAAHLANRATSAKERKQYLSWAEREWQWFLHSGMINSENLINDGLEMSSCKNNGKTTWTYNQGVIVGGLAELDRAKHHSKLLSEANAIAGAAIVKLVDKQGILHDTCEPDCGGDGVQFKGIFVRNLRSLQEIAPNPRYEQFLYQNADGIWNHSRNEDNKFGTVWSGLYAPANAGSQASALDAILAAAQVQQQKEKGRNHGARH